MALKSDGTLYLWGRNDWGEIGNGSSGTDVKSPWLLGSLTGITQVATGFSNSIALKSDGTVYVWGDNSCGQGGNGASGGNQTTPTQVSSLSGISQVAAGNDHCLALKSDGTLYAWGNNGFGEIGNGSSGAGVLTPTPVLSGTAFIAMEPSSYHSLAVKAQATLTMVVSPASSGTTSPTVGSSFVNKGEAQNITATVATGYTFSGWTSYGNTTFNSASSASTTVTLSGDATVIANFTYSGCAVGWGYNYYGAIGDGTTTLPGHDPENGHDDADGPCLKSPQGHFTRWRSRPNGTVWASGSNSYGQLGINNTTDKSSPAQVLKGASSSATEYLTGVVQVAAGGSHSIALKSDGTVWAWGSNSNGQLGDGTSGAGTDKLTPVQVGGSLTGVVLIGAGESHSLAVKNDGTVWAWGSNSNGQLGDATTANRSTPVQVLKGTSSSSTDYLTGVVQICGGFAHSVALKSDDTVFAWGLNNSAQLGDGTYTQRTIPVQVLRGASSSATAYLTGVVQIGAGLIHSIALKSDGTVLRLG